MKKFYIETFGCQMNAHDSEKVIGTLLPQGYPQVETPERGRSVLYNTCSIRDKAEQKVFNRLQTLQAEHGKDKMFGVLGCVAQQEGEKIFDRAPHVSLVCGSASYHQACRRLLVQLEAGNRRVTGLSLDTDETFDTPFTRRDNPHRAYITIIEGCDKSCAYCVVPFTRGPERSRTSESVMARGAPPRRAGLHRNPAARTERQQLSRSVARRSGISPRCWRASARSPASAACATPPRIRATSCKAIVDAMDANPAALRSRAPAGAVRLDPRAGRHAPALHARRVHAAHRVDEERAAATIAITTDIIVGFPGETEDDFQATLDLLDEVQYDSALQLQVLAAAEYAGAAAWRTTFPKKRRRGA